MREQRAKRKAKLRQQEQRTSDEVRTQFVPSGARTDRAGKTEYLIFLQIHDIAKRNTLFLQICFSESYFVEITMVSCVDTAGIFI